MTGRSVPGKQTQHTALLRRVYGALCWATLIATAAAACIGVAVLAGMVLQGIWPS